MKLKDVIDIDGKLYQIIHVSRDGSFEAEPIVMEVDEENERLVIVNKKDVKKEVDK